VVYHVTTHSLAKASLFLSVGVAVKKSGARDLERLEPLGRGDPALAAAVIAACLSLIGVPPMGGFFSKLALYRAFLASGKHYLVAALLVSTGFSLVGYMRVLHSIVLKPPKPGASLRPEREEALARAPPLALGLALLALNPLLVGGLVEMAARGIADPSGYAAAALAEFYGYFLSLGGG